MHSFFRRPVPRKTLQKPGYSRNGRDVIIDDIERSAEAITNDIVAAAQSIARFPPKGEVVTINVLARLPASKRQEIGERLPSICAQKGLRLKSVPNMNEQSANCFALSFFAT